VFIENAQKALLYADRAGSMARAASAGQLGKLLLGVSLLLISNFSLGSETRSVRDTLRSNFNRDGLAHEQAEWAMRSDIHAGLIELPIRYPDLLS